MRKLTKKEHQLLNSFESAMIQRCKGGNVTEQVEAKLTLKDHLRSLEPSSPVNWKLWLRKPTTLLLTAVLVSNLLTLLLIVGTTYGGFNVSP